LTPTWERKKGEQVFFEKKSYWSAVKWKKTKQCWEISFNAKRQNTPNRNRENRTEEQQPLGPKSIAGGRDEKDGVSTTP